MKHHAGFLWLLLLLPGVAADYTCATYSASNTNSAQQNYVECNFNFCLTTNSANSYVIVEHTGACDTNAWWTMYRGTTYQWAQLGWNYNSQCVGSPQMGVAGSVRCETWTLRQGCTGSTSCSSTFKLVGPTISGPTTNCVGAWGSYSSCSATCGTGTQTSTYTITTAASGGGTACTYSNGATQTQACSAGTCPVDCSVSFSSWSACSVTCGSGQQTRVATITVNPAGSGAPCVTTPTTRSCGTETCTVTVSANLAAGVCGSLTLTGTYNAESPSPTPVAQPTPTPVPVAQPTPVPTPVAQPTPVPTPIPVEQPTPTPVAPTPVEFGFTPTPVFVPPPPVASEPVPEPFVIIDYFPPPATIPLPPVPTPLPPVPAYTYRWLRSSDSNPNNAVAISGATATTYSPTATDVGYYIFFEVTPSGQSAIRVKASQIGAATGCASQLAGSPFGANRRTAGRTRT